MKTAAQFGLTKEQIMRHVVAIAPPVHKSYNPTLAARIEQGLTIRGTPRKVGKYPELAGLRGIEYSREYNRLIRGKKKNLPSVVEKPDNSNAGHEVTVCEPRVSALPARR